MVHTSSSLLRIPFYYGRSTRLAPVAWAESRRQREWRSHPNILAPDVKRTVESNGRDRPLFAGCLKRPHLRLCSAGRRGSLTFPRSINRQRDLEISSTDLLRNEPGGDWTWERTQVDAGREQRHHMYSWN